jgi:hypothetical protein
VLLVAEVRGHAALFNYDLAGLRCYPCPGAVDRGVWTVTGSPLHVAFDDDRS